jgi:hypothetical protein
VTHLTAAQATSNQRQRYGGRSAFGILDSGRSAIRDSAGFLRGSGFGVHAPRAPTDGCPHSPFVPQIIGCARRAAVATAGGGWLCWCWLLAVAVCCVLLALLGSPWATPVVAWARSWQCKSNGVGVDVHVSRRRPTPAPPPTPGRLRLRLHEPKVGWGRCISAGTSPMQGNRPRHQPLPDRRVVMFLACCSVLAVP